MAITLDGTTGITTPAEAAGNISYTGTLTGGTGVVNLGTGQLYKDASGNVGIGTTSPTNNAGYKSVTISSTNGGWLEVTNGTVRGILQNGAGDVTLETRSAHPLIFGVNSTERARIDSSGNLLVGATSGSSRLVVQGIGSVWEIAQVNQSNTNPALIRYSNTTAAIWDVGLGNSVADVVFNFRYQGVQKAWISQVNGVYTSTSDARLKENVSDLSGVLDKVLALRPVSYNFIADGNKEAQIGFVAQEVLPVVPEVVGRPTTEGGFYGINYAGLTPLLVKAIQEQQAIITSLTARITALETK